MPENVIVMVRTAKEWNKIKRNIRSIRKTCHNLDDAEDGIKCFAAVDEMQDKIRGVFQKRRRRGPFYIVNP